MAVTRNSLLTAVCWLFLATKTIQCGSWPVGDPSTKALADISRDLKDIQIYKPLNELQLILSPARRSAQCRIRRFCPLNAMRSLAVLTSTCSPRDAFSYLPFSASVLSLSYSLCLLRASAVSPSATSSVCTSGNFSDCTCALESGLLLPVTERNRRHYSRRETVDKKNSPLSDDASRDLPGLQNFLIGNHCPGSHSYLPRILVSSESDLDYAALQSCPNVLPKRKLPSDKRSQATLAVLTELTLTPVANLKELLQLFIDKEDWLPTEACRDILFFRLLNLTPSSGL